MADVKTCGACGEAITVCPNCGGKLCVDGCPDRVEDGCTCVINAENDDEEAEPV